MKTLGVKRPSWVRRPPSCRYRPMGDDPRVFLLRHPGKDIQGVPHELPSEGEHPSSGKRQYLPRVRVGGPEEKGWHSLARSSPSRRRIPGGTMKPRQNESRGRPVANELQKSGYRMDKSMISGKSSGAADVCRSAPGNQGEGATARCLAVSDRSVLQSILPLKIPPDNPRDRKNRVRLTMVSAAWLAMALLLSATLTWGEGLGPEDKAAAENSALTPASGADQQSVTLPGILLNLQERCVDVESVVCLEEGTLELVACTKGSKEHESIVAIGAKPVHVHTALLLLGAESGNPAMRQMVDDAEPRWIHLPPRGDPVAVSLVCADLEGKLVERPIRKLRTSARRGGGDREGAQVSDGHLSFFRIATPGRGGGSAPLPERLERQCDLSRHLRRRTALPARRLWAREWSSDVAGRQHSSPRRRHQDHSSSPSSNQARSQGNSGRQVDSREGPAMIVAHCRIALRTCTE